MLMLLTLLGDIVGKVVTTIIRTYSELITLPTFLERYYYLRLNGIIGEETFGNERYLNQIFYNSKEWKMFRRDIIVRDMGNDLGVEGREIGGLIIVHHLNPITIDDILQRSKSLIDPENAICAGVITHKAIHYGDESLLMENPVERRKNDTCPWRQN